MWNRLAGAGNNMQLPVFAYSKPAMLIIMKRLGYLLQLHYIFIKSSAFSKIYHIQGKMIEMRLCFYS